MPKLTTQLRGGVMDAANLRFLVALTVGLVAVGFVANLYISSDLPGAQQIRNWLPLQTA